MAAHENSHVQLEDTTTGFKFFKENPRSGKPFLRTKIPQSKGKWFINSNEFIINCNIKCILSVI